jgi:hypothetical protein
VASTTCLKKKKPLKNEEKEKSAKKKKSKKRERSTQSNQFPEIQISFIRVFKEFSCLSEI